MRAVIRGWSRANASTTSRMKAFSAPGWQHPGSLTARPTISPPQTTIAPVSP